MHTPAPWRVEAAKPARFPQYRILTATDHYVAEVTIMAHNPAKSDAALIAAAPELLSALVHLEQAYANKHSPQHRAAALSEARAIITKAKGGGA
jgi:hypothetical protein